MSRPVDRDIFIHPLYRTQKSVSIPNGPGISHQPEIVRAAPWTQRVSPSRLLDCRYAGFFDDCLWRRVLCDRDLVRAGLREDVRLVMLLDYVLGGIVAIIIIVYLVYALINPERF